MKEQKEQEYIEKAVLVGLNCETFTFEQNSCCETLDELSALLETAGGECIAKLLQHRKSPDAKTFIGEGKAEEVKQIAAANDADIIIFDNDLSPSHIRNLEEITKVTVLDRSALILDIFAQRAKTGEGKLQVELAQYQYILPRLSGIGGSMSRLGGGIGTRGPGETKLETDKRHIRKRIDKLKADIEQLSSVRDVQRRQRKKTEIPLVSIVGYTNAGKSTIMNWLTDANIDANDRLFDTLDITTRKKKIANEQYILLSDTVGFIRKLPYNLVSAFKATLKELQYADLLLHVVDVSDPNWEIHFETVNYIIKQLEANEIPKIVVYNKIDKCEIFPKTQEKSVAISAKKGIGEKELLKAIIKELGIDQIKTKLFIPYSNGNIVDVIHKKAKVLNVEYQQEGIAIQAILDSKIFGQVKMYKIE